MSAAAVPAVNDGFAVLGALEVDPQALEAEDTFFASTVDFVARRGGPVTRQFLEVLPAAWRGEHIVIDSELVWLSRGKGGGVPWFHFETYPYRCGAAFDVVNREIDVEHVAVHIGPGDVDVLRGDIDSALRSPIAGSPFPHAPSKECGVRDRTLNALLEDGKLSVVPVGSGTIYRHGGGAFLRYRVAEAAGFRLWLRATRGSRRPVVNGIRNLVH